MKQEMKVSLCQVSKFSKEDYINQLKREETNISYIAHGRTVPLMV